MAQQQFEEEIVGEDKMLEKKMVADWLSYLVVSLFIFSWFKINFVGVYEF
jgi:nitrate reductase NapE component